MTVSAYLCLSVLLFLAAGSAAADALLTPVSNLSFVIPASNGDWSVTLRPWKGTIAAIQPNTSDPFSFINDDTPANYSSLPNYHSHGDISLRLRPVGSSRWQHYTTADVYSAPALTVDIMSGELAAFDVTSLMRPGSGLRVVKRYAVAALNTSQPSSGLTLEVEVSNTANETVEIGAFGVSALFSSNWNDMDLSQAAAYCSLAEPYIGGEHGYVKVTRLTGTERVLLMTPTEGYRSTSGLSAWRQLKGEDGTQTGYAFEGHYEWTSVVGAWQEEWKQSQPWVRPSHPTLTLKPAATLKFRYSQLPPPHRTSPHNPIRRSHSHRWWFTHSTVCLLAVCVGVAYQLVDSVRSVDDALVHQGNVSIRAVPGYILSTEMRSAKLYIHPPAYTNKLAFNISGTGDLTLTADPTSSSAPYLAYHIRPLTAGRVHLAIHFPPPPNSQLPPTTAHVSLLVLPPFHSHLESLGRFTSHNQWVSAETADPFGRSSSVMPYDFEDGTVIWQDERSYVVGLSDEAGAGPGLQLMMSQRYAPFDQSLQLVDEYINQTLWGVKLPPEVPYATSVQNANYSIRASMFW